MAIPKRLGRFLLAATAAVTVVAATGGSAHAAGTSATPAGSKVSVALQSLMELYPGSEVVSEDTLRIAPGVDITMPPDQPRDKRVLSKEAVKAALASPDPVRPAASLPAKALAPVRAIKPAERAAAAAGGSVYTCEYKYLCLWADAGFISGYKIRFYDCAFMDLGAIKFPPGGRWNDKVSAYVNNQTDGANTYFYNWNGVSSWNLLFSSTALDWNSNIGVDMPAYNNVIDGVHVCDT
ncbi:hypothetical protein ABZ356_10355 [Micromonospora zamorensis]|uniref:hypothetical protein n=1 Tax=Micromonospora zamorensis TaxID=709883 RepID=UPI0033BEAC1C